MEPITATLYTAYAIVGVSALIILVVILYSERQKKIQHKHKAA